jgi:hypothetical protein
MENMQIRRWNAKPKDAWVESFFRRPQILGAESVRMLLLLPAVSEDLLGFTQSVFGKSTPGLRLDEGGARLWAQKLQERGAPELAERIQKFVHKNAPAGSK